MRTRDLALALAAPALLIILVFMVVPMGIALAYSLLSANPYGGVTPPLTAAAYVRFFYDRDLDDLLVFDPTYLNIFWRSTWLAAMSTVLCLIGGLPVAWYIATRSARVRQVLVLLVTVPFWTNLLIRIYCWVLILRDNGLLNHAMQSAGLTHAPITFLYSDGAILLGLVYSNLPFMILPIQGVLERIDARLIEAAYDLYASRTTIMRRLVWPLARPGILAGVTLVFVPTLGAFLAPDILGGGRRLMIGSLIQQQFTTGRNWPFGSALSMILLATVMIVMMAGAWRRAAGAIAT